MDKPTGPDRAPISPCGLRARPARTGPSRPFADPEWEEVTLDIDATCAAGHRRQAPRTAHPSRRETFDAVYSAHNLEHLYPHEVPLALAAFKRVLEARTAFVIVTCPDLQSIGEQIASGDIDDTALREQRSALSPPLDMLYGFRPAMAQRQPLYGPSHGFHPVRRMQESASTGFGLPGRPGRFRGKHRDLWTIGAKGVRSERIARPR